MKKKKVLVLTDDMPWGHRSIAKAIYNYLKANEKENNLKVSYMEVKAQIGILNDLYLLAYRYFPKSGKINNLLMEKEIAREFLRESNMMDYERLKKAIGRSSPDVIVSSYLFHSHSLAKWRRCEHLNFKLVTVVADPWTFNPISFVPEADMHLVYDDVAVKKSKKFNIEPDKVTATGWWTRQEMFKEYNKKEARKKMGFKDNRPVIFVGGGSLGTNALPKVLPMLLMVEKPIGVIFNSGTDKLAYNMVEEYERMFKRLRKNDMVQIANLGWIENMAEVLNACDIVFGKAGPNFLFDVAATKRPFVAITHIGGQEDGNIDIIENKKLGWVKERSRDLTKFFLRYTQNPEEFNLKYIENIKAEADRNEKSLPKVLEIVKKM